MCDCCCREKLPVLPAYETKMRRSLIFSSVFSGIWCWKHSNEQLALLCRTYPHSQKCSGTTTSQCKSVLQFPRIICSISVCKSVFRIYLLVAATMMMMWTCGVYREGIFVDNIQHSSVHCELQAYAWSWGRGQ